MARRQTERTYLKAVLLWLQHTGPNKRVEVSVGKALLGRVVDPGTLETLRLK